MRCKEALDGLMTFGSENELQQQRAKNGRRTNRRRVASSFERTYHFAQAKSKDHGYQDSTIISFKKLLIQQQQQRRQEQQQSSAYPQRCVYAHFAFTLEGGYIPQFLGGNFITHVTSLSQLSRPISLGHYTCVEPSRLKRLTRCRIYPWEAIELGGMTPIIPHLPNASEQELKYLRS